MNRSYWEEEFACWGWSRLAVPCVRYRYTDQNQVHCTRYSQRKPVMPWEELKQTNPPSLWVASMHTLKPTLWYGDVGLVHVVMLTEVTTGGSFCCASWTLSSNTEKYASALGSLGHRVTRRFLYDIRRIVPIGIGRLCQKGSGSPSSRLQATSGKSTGLTNVQD